MAFKSHEQEMKRITYIPITEFLKHKKPHLLLWFFPTTSGIRKEVGNFQKRLAAQLTEKRMILVLLAMKTQFLSSSNHPRSIEGIQRKTSNSTCLIFIFMWELLYDKVLGFSFITNKTVDDCNMDVNLLHFTYL